MKNSAACRVNFAIQSFIFIFLQNIKKRRLISFEVPKLIKCKNCGYWEHFFKFWPTFRKKLKKDSYFCLFFSCFLLIGVDEDKYLKALPFFVDKKSLKIYINWWLTRYLPTLQPNQNLDVLCRHKKMTSVKGWWGYLRLL